MIMFLIKMINFCKNSECPSSQDLLGFQNNELAPTSAAFISEHLELCDFCGAEVELYSQFPEIDEKVSLSEIPAPLFELAQFLLTNGHKDRSLLDKLLIEDKGLSLKEACG